MSKKNRRALRRSLLTLSLVLVVAFAAVGGTIAWLTSTTGPVTNTFTVGSVNITLDEKPVDLYGVEVEGARRTENQYKLLPGHNYTKDPTVHVTLGSEPCWVFVKVENGISAIEDNKTIAAQIVEKGWTELETGVYYKQNVDARTEAKDLVVFDSFTIKKDADVAANATKKIIITAYAVQADGITEAADAWSKCVK